MLRRSLVRGYENGRRALHHRPAHPPAHKQAHRLPHSLSEKSGLTFFLTCIQDSSGLKDSIEAQRRSEDVRVVRRHSSCRCGLPRAEGRKVAAARGEGRSPKVTIELVNEATSRPSSQRDVATFQAAERRSASRQRFVVAPVGALSAELASNFTFAVGEGSNRRLVFTDPPTAGGGFWYNTRFNGEVQR